MVAAVTTYSEENGSEVERLFVSIVRRSPLPRLLRMLHYVPKDAFSSCNRFFSRGASFPKEDNRPIKETTMPARKDTAHRPSQAHLEFVTTKDGRRVRNTAYTAGAPKTSPVSRKPLAPKPASNPADADEAENVISAALDQLETSTSKTDFAESVKPGTGVTAGDRGYVIGRFRYVCQVPETCSGVRGFGQSLQRRISTRRG